MKEKNFEDYNIEVNTQNFISQKILSDKVRKTLDTGNIDINQIEALQRMTLIFNQKIGVDIHQVKMKFNKEYELEQAALEEVREEQKTVENFMLHLIEEPGNDIESFKKDDLGKEVFTEGELFHLNKAFKDFSEELERDVIPKMQDKKHLFEQLDICYDTADIGSTPNCDEIKLFWMFSDLYYKTMDESEELNLNHEEVFISNVQGD